MRKLISHPLWIGHAGDGRDAGRLLELGIQAVVQLAVEEPPLQLPRELIVLRVPLVDGGENDLVWLLVAVRVVSQLLAGNVPALVCCSAGLSRSPAIAAAALADFLAIDANRCLAEVAAVGPIDVSPLLWKQIHEVLDA